MELAVKARSLARALAWGFAEPAPIVAWVDELIVAQDRPDWFLLDASLAERRVPELVSALESFADRTGSPPPQLVAHALLGHLHQWLLRHPEDGRRIARLLHHMVVESDLPARGAEGDMYYFDDAYDLADSGVYGSVENVNDELKSFLEGFARTAR